MFSFKINKTVKYLFAATLPLFLFCLTTNSVAQQSTAEGDSSNLSATVKIMGIAPAVGIGYQLTQNSKLRGIGFFTIDTGSSVADGYLLDLSYIRNVNTVESINSYWGLNLSLQYNNVIIGPGFLVGSSYELNKNFSVFGEAGLNIFFVDGSNSATINMFNSGVGVSVSL